MAEIYVGPKLALVDFPQEFLREVKNICTIPNPDHTVFERVRRVQPKMRRMPNPHPRNILTWDYKAGMMLIPRGLLECVRLEAAKRGISYTLTPLIVEPKPSVPLQVDPSYILDTGQLNAVRLAAARQGGVIEGKTGSGKTLTSFKLVEVLQLRTLFLVNTDVLTTQTMEEAEKVFGVKPGLIKGQTMDIQDFTVGSIQTLVRRGLKEISKEFGILIQDESLPYETPIATDRGPIPIGQLVEKQLPVRVWSFNHETGHQELRPITRFHAHAPKSPMLRVVLESEIQGANLLCTANHKVFVLGRGYIAAADLQAGDSLIPLVGCNTSVHQDAQLLNSGAVRSPGWVLARRRLDRSSQQGSTSREMEGQRSMGQGYFPAQASPQGTEDQILQSMWRSHPTDQQVPESSSLRTRLPSAKTFRVLRVETTATPKLVYDLEVEHNHNFFADGILVHNCHLASADTFQTVLGSFYAARIYGLSGTPKDGRLPPLMFQAIGPHLTTLSSVRVVPVKVHQIPTPYTPSRVFDPFEKTEHITELSTDSQRNSFIVSHLNSNLRSSAKSLILTERVDHAELLYQKLTSTNPQLQIVLYHGQLKPDSRRKAILQTIKHQTPQVTIATYKAIGTGTDVPPWEDIYLASPLTSPATIKQAIGRARRVHGNKVHCSVYDYVDPNDPTLVDKARRRLDVYEDL